ncbi:MAG: FAD-dependent oxidoreductase, partial [Lentisphaeria bacterium]|nr:FAD-dependent oxidoreductase [Lentisphaeria bacterium]
MQTFREEAREIPVLTSVDVLVIGAGPAGIGAALAAAENGAVTMLVEQSGKIGGMATSGMMSHWSGSSESPMLQRIVNKMRSLRGGYFLLQDGRNTI